MYIHSSTRTYKFKAKSIPRYIPEARLPLTCRHAISLLSRSVGRSCMHAYTYMTYRVRFSHAPITDGCSYRSGCKFGVCDENARAKIVKLTRHTTILVGLVVVNVHTPSSIFDTRTKFLMRTLHSRGSSRVTDGLRRQRRSSLCTLLHRFSYEV